MLRSSLAGPASATAFLLVLQLGILSAPTALGYPQPGREGALQFDGLDDYVNLGNRPSLQLSGDLSVCAWCQMAPGTAGQYLGIAGKMAWLDEAYHGFAIVRHWDNHFYFWVGTEGTLYGQRSDVLYTDSEWHHVAGVIRSGTGYLYVDGALAKTGWPGLQVVDSGQYASIGKHYSDWSDSNGHFFAGLIDEVRFYDRGLTAAEVGTVRAGGLRGDGSLAGLWDMEEGGGQTVTDGSGKSNHGYLGNSSSTSGDAADPRWVGGGSPPPDDGPLPGGDYPQVGGLAALEFDGVDDYVTLGNDPSLQLSGDFSVCAWARLGEDTAGRYMGIAGKMNTNYDGFTLARRDTNKFVFFIGCPYDLYIFNNPRTTTDSEWHHVAGVVRGGRPYFYVDGESAGTPPSDWSNLQIVDSGQYAFVGRQYSEHQGRFFEGLIDEVYFYDRGLSAPEVQAMLSTHPSTSDTSLAGHWSFDETSGQTVLDGSMMGNDGYLGNAASPDTSDPWRVFTGGSPGTPYEVRWSHLLTFNSQADMGYITEYDPRSPLLTRLTYEQPDPYGMLRMLNFDVIIGTGGRVVVPARATCVFAGARRPTQPFEWLQITFDYLFRSEEGTLMVRASNGAHEVSAPSITPPSPALPGGSASMTWGEYSVCIPLAYDPAVDNSVSVTLELMGPADAQVLINDLSLEGLSLYTPSWSASYLLNTVLDSALSVHCNMSACDIAGPESGYNVGKEDYLAAVYGCGAEVPADMYCVDSPFTDDGVVSVEDIEYWDWVTSGGMPCGGGGRISALSPSSVGTLASVSGYEPSAPLIIAGKAYSRELVGWLVRREFQWDGLFGCNTNSQLVGAPEIGEPGSLNTRLVKDARGLLYRLNVTRRLVRLFDGNDILPRGDLDYNGTPVYVGWSQSYGSPPLQDAAFDRDNNLYVVPVLVSPYGQASYRAAARIDLSGASPRVTKLYGASLTEAQLYGREQLDSSGVHEIEVDHLQNVYVLDKRHWYDSALLQYSGAQVRRTEPDELGWPEALHVSRSDGQIFVFRGGSLRFLSPNDLRETKSIEVRGLDFVTDITESEAGIPSQRAIWVVGFSITSKPASEDVEDGDTVTYDPRYKPYLAKVLFSSNGPVQATCLVDEYAESEEEYLSLPLSIVRTGDDF